MFFQSVLIALILLQQILAQSIVYTVENANKFIEENKSKVNQTYRLNYHFTPPLGWMNDPNGFIYYQGAYHLFYQFNPYDTIPNKIHWGHAKSNDLINWEHLPVALAPDQEYDKDGVFSGSAIEKDGKLYVMYTGNSNELGQVQCMAISEDGILFNKILQNPVLDHSTLPANAQPEDFRDPKMFKRGNTYYVVLASKTKSNTGQILLYQSADLITWTFKSILLQGSKETGIMWECPDLFELDGKDVLLLSPIEMPSLGNNYRNYDSVIQFVGVVNWETGTMDVHAMKELDHGMDFYATQSLLDANGRRIVIAWMSMWRRNYPTHTLKHGWAGSMTIPRELNLKNGYITQKFPYSLDFIFNKSKTYRQISLNREMIEFELISGKTGMLDLVVELVNDTIFTIELRKSGEEKTIITYDSHLNLLELNRRYSGILVTGAESPPVFSRAVYVPLEESKLKLTILIDTSSVEIFANDGVETMTANIYPTKEDAVSIAIGAYESALIESLTFSTINDRTPNHATKLTCVALYFSIISILFTKF